MAAIVVTGSSSGIGEATVLRLASAGHEVFAAVRREADAERLASAAPGIRPLLLDVTRSDTIDAAAATLTDVLGPSGLDALVNNAGVANGGPLEFVSPQVWTDTFDTNVFGQVAVTVALLPLLRRARGRIIFVGSAATRLPTPYMAPYVGSKYAIVGIARTLSEELSGSGMSVVLVEPGAVKTPIWEKGHRQIDELEQEFSERGAMLYPDALDRVRANIDALTRLGSSPDRIARVIERALVAQRPRPVQLAGIDAHIAGFLDRFVPARLMSRLLNSTKPVQPR